MVEAKEAAMLMLQMEKSRKTCKSDEKAERIVSERMHLHDIPRTVEMAQASWAVNE